jgi:Uma2 family endonuclease
MSAEITKRLFTVRDYHRMVDAGILRENDRVELIYGEVLAMSPIGSPHGAHVDRATRAFVRAAGDLAIVRVQGNVELDQYNEPLPDIVLMRPKEDFYASGLPDPTDVFLIVEVSDSSLKYDRGLKARLYAETGIREYWVVDVENKRAFAYSDPQDGTYQTMRELPRGETLSPILLPDCCVSIDTLLG